MVYVEYVAKGKSYCPQRKGRFVIIATGDTDVVVVGEHGLSSTISLKRGQKAEIHCDYVTCLTPKHADVVVLQNIDISTIDQPEEWSTTIFTDGPFATGGSFSYNKKFSVEGDWVKVKLYIINTSDLSVVDIAVPFNLDARDEEGNEVGGTGAIRSGDDVEVWRGKYITGTLEFTIPPTVTLSDVVAVYIIRTRGRVDVWQLTGGGG